MLRDIESAGEGTPLLPSKKERPWLEEFEAQPVGGYPGNSAFRGQVFLALRCSLFACFLASLMWVPSAQPYLDQGEILTTGFAKYFPLFVLVIFFTMSPIFGTILCNATAAILGTSFAVVNIYVLRGFFPQGVRPGEGHLALASLFGWFNIAIFNLIFLALDVRAGVKMFAMAFNTGFMLSFLNPEDNTPFSMNFHVDRNCTAVNCLKFTCLACLLTLLANLLPVPFRFAITDMQANAKRVSAYVAKDFIATVQHCQGGRGTALIDRQLACTELTESQVQAMWPSITSAWYEGVDIGVLGSLRHLHKKHGTLAAELVEISKAMKIAIKTNDFSDQHLFVMKHIGCICGRLAESAGELLMCATRVVTDGGVGSAGKSAERELEDRETLVKEDVKSVAKVFDTTRRSWTPIYKDLLGESFFVFALSAYARKVVEFSETVRGQPSSGQGVLQTLTDGFRSTFTLERVGENHSATAARYWLVLMIGFTYCVFLDSYRWVCACTIVIIYNAYNSRVAPEVTSFLNGVTGVAIASIMSAIIFNTSCHSGLGEWILPSLSFFYWWLMLYIHFSGCASALIGFLGAALASFVLVARCPGAEVGLTWSAEAMRLGINFRRFMVAFLIVSIAEYFLRKNTLTKNACEALNKALLDLDEALKQVFDSRNPTEALSSVSALLAEARAFGKAAVQEPRAWRCKWKHDLLMEVARWADMLHLDITMMHLAMSGANGKSSAVVEVLNRVSAIASIKHDLEKSLDAARLATYQLMKHEWGEFTSSEEMKTIERNPELDGLEDAIMDTNQVDIVEFSSRPIVTLENDILCRTSVMFLMLDHATKRTACILEACVRQS